MGLEKPILIVSTVTEDSEISFPFMHEQKMLEAIEESNATGIFVTDFRRIRKGIFDNSRKLILSDSSVSDISPATKRFVLYTQDFQRYEEQLECYSLSKSEIVPSIYHINQVRIFNKYQDKINYDFIDIGPVGLCSREKVCGSPLRLRKVKELLGELREDVPYVLSGGIRIESQKGQSIYSIEEILSEMPRPPMGIIVGSNISGVPPEQISKRVNEYLEELNKYLN